MWLLYSLTLQNGRTALHMAALGGDANVNAVQMLLDHGADPNIKDTAVRLAMLMSSDGLPALEE